MAPIKSSISRVLRSRIPISKQITASRGLTRTATNANAVEYSVHSSQPAPYFPPDQRFRPSFPLTNTTPSSSIFPSALSSPTPLPPTVVQTVQTPSFSSLISSLSSSLTSTSKPDLKHLNSLLRSYTSVPGQWDRFAHKDPSMQYTRNLVMSVEGVFDLILLVWTPGKKSPVHDHAGADCLMKVLQGELRERRFAIPERPGEQGSLVKTSELGFGLNKVSYMADVLGLHEISNPSSTEYAMSLHLYTPPNASLRGCHVYDIEHGKRNLVRQGPWHSVDGRRV